jgi:hypothetical protein
LKRNGREEKGKGEGKGERRVGAGRGGVRGRSATRAAFARCARKESRRR